MTPRPPNAAYELRKHYASVRARLWATKPQQARVAKRTPDISPVPEPMPGPEQPEVRSMRSREYGGSTIGYWEMRISRLTLSFMSRPPISTSPSPNSFRPGGSVTLSARVRSQSILRARFCARPNRHAKSGTISIAITQRSSVPAARSRRGSRPTRFLPNWSALFACTWRARKRSPSYLTQSKPSARKSSAT
jgi:hypothetical protein